MPWYLYLALKQLRPTGKKFGSFFFVMSVLGVALGVMVLIVVQSVMGGFGQEHRARAIDVSGHLDITARGRPFVFQESLRSVLEEDQRVVSYGPYGNGFVLAQFGSAWDGTAAYGIDPRMPDAYGVSRFLTEGTTDDLGDDSAIISTTLSWASRRAGRGRD